ncbi:MAG: hypothetical protein ACRD2O_13415, partial [Terriglobia bacterium]
GWQCLHRSNACQNITLYHELQPRWLRFTRRPKKAETPNWIKKAMGRVEFHNSILTALQHFNKI